jgi:putative ubiquitin-RnfH superfamily antitoxin RatB of RatAB toxin-antitoxin module
MKVAVAYALADRQTLLRLEVPESCTVEEAIRQSGILALHPDIDLAVNRLGINGKVKPPGTPLHPGDRVEIYRPRQADPKEARRQRVGRGTGL